jgi:Deoxyribonuclease II
MHAQADAAYVMWNNEFPGGHVALTGAHAKGVIGFGEQQGFWLLHSVRSRCQPTVKSYCVWAHSQLVEHIQHPTCHSL